MKTSMTKAHNNGLHRPPAHNGKLFHREPLCTAGGALQSHANSAHGGTVDPNCPACREIQERYGVAAK